LLYKLFLKSLLSEQATATLRIIEGGFFRSEKPSNKDSARLNTTVASEAKAAIS
jgi:hypothetical protein